MKYRYFTKLFPRTVFWLVAWLTLPWVLLVFPQIVSDIKRLPAAIRSDGPAKKIIGMHLVEVTGVMRDWELFAREAIAESSEVVWSLEEVRLLLYSEEDDVRFRITSDAGTYDSESKSIGFTGGVRTYSASGYEIETPDAWYEGSTKLLTSDLGVSMLGPSRAGRGPMRLKSGQMRVVVPTGQILVSQEVRLVRQVPKGGTVEVDSDHAEFSSSENTARFWGNVRIRIDGNLMVGDRAFFEYDSKTDELRYLTLEGNVRVNSGDKLVQSETLDVDLNEETYVFKGNPRLTQDGEVVTGDKIVFVDKGSTVRVSRARVLINKT